MRDYCWPQGTDGINECDGLVDGVAYDTKLAFFDIGLVKRKWFHMFMAIAQIAGLDTVSRFCSFAIPYVFILVSNNTHVLIVILYSFIQH